jgi:hypothetical protein
MDRPYRSELTGQIAQARTSERSCLDAHLAECAREARLQATLLPDSRLRDVLLEKARQYEAQISQAY